MNNQTSNVDAHQAKSDTPFIKDVALKPDTANQNRQGDTPPMRKGDTFSSREIDKLDHHILILVSEKCHENSIIHLTKRPRSTIKDRLNRLQKWGFIKPYYFQTALQRVKLFDLTQKAMQILIHNENAPTHSVIQAHAMTFSFPILEGPQPKSAQAFKMNNWTGYVFENINHVIRTTPRSVIIDVNLDLGSDSIDNLNIKYYELAQKYAVEFAEKHKIRIGGGKRSRNPDYATMNIPVVQCVADRGNFRTPTGIKIDKSRSNGDLEFSQEQTARNFEFVINDMPKAVLEIKAEIVALRKTVELQNGRR